MDYGPLLGQERQAGKTGTIGGVLAANLSGPRRLKAGAARDHILGINAVSGSGEAFKSGGRVVKNVTGYDLSKLMAGSWGTLAVVTGLTFKVLPAAETETTLAIRGLTDENAVQGDGARHGIERGSVGRGASAIRHRRPHRFRFCLAPIAATLLRVEGFGPSVTYRIFASERTAEKSRVAR